MVFVVVVKIQKKNEDLIPLHVSLSLTPHSPPHTQCFACPHKHTSKSVSGLHGTQGQMGRQPF